ncbi:MAG: hypothetical protein C0391_01925 [Anaerolinea sp.]|nr:hypothetical protein [Anaerolinea sp.]
MRVRINFEKTEAMRFTGHLDLQHAWMRVFRRAGIALEHSQGFHPLPKIQLASALPLGYISTAEILDAWLIESQPIIDLVKILNDNLPPGLEINSIEQIPLDAPKIQVALKTADYLVHLSSQTSLQNLPVKVAAFLAEAEILIERRGKRRDIRNLVELLEMKNSSDGQQAIYMRLSARESATGRPDEILIWMGIDPFETLIERTTLNI